MTRVCSLAFRVSACSGLHLSSWILSFLLQTGCLHPYCLLASLPSPHYPPVHARALPGKMEAGSATTLIQTLLNVKHWAITWQRASLGPTLQFTTIHAVCMSTLLPTDSLLCFSVTKQYEPTSLLGFAFCYIFMFYSIVCRLSGDFGFIPSLPYCGCPLLVT